MSDFEYWRLCEQLTLVQAALLMAGYDPEPHEGDVEGWASSSQPAGYAACRQALIGAINSKRLEGHLFYDEGDDLNGNPYSVLVAQKSWVMTSGIPAWLHIKGMRTGFFFPDQERPKEYLDPDNERFAPKLAAAIRAWQAVGEDKSTKGTPKQRIEKWLRLHASEFGLVQKDGKPNESAIKSIARIANWKPEGGAPNTLSSGALAPGAVNSASRKIVPLKQAIGGVKKPNLDMDDDIPF